MRRITSLLAGAGPSGFDPTLGWEDLLPVWSGLVGVAVATLIAVALAAYAGRPADGAAELGPEGADPEPTGDR